MASKPPIYGPPARPGQGEAPGSSRTIKVPFPDKPPPSVVEVQAFSYERRFGGTPIAIRFQDKAPPSVVEVQAFSYDRRYGAYFEYPPFPVVVAAGTEYKTYVPPHDIGERIFPSYSVEAVADITDVSTYKTFVKAHNPADRIFS